MQESYLSMGSYPNEMGNQLRTPPAKIGQVAYVATLMP